MKKTVVLLSIAFIWSCNEPVNITGKTDPQNTTSGTMGSVKANNQLPNFDTPAVNTRPDTLKKQ
jgi:hypothetical protein